VADVEWTSDAARELQEALERAIPESVRKHGIIVLPPGNAAESELEKINDILRAHGFEYPLGARGVQGLADGYRVRQEELHQLDPDNWAAVTEPHDPRPPGMYRAPLPFVPPPVEHCCVCASAEVVYHNYLEKPFCGPCADGDKPLSPILPVPVDDPEGPRPEPRPLEYGFGLPGEYLTRRDGIISDDD